MSRGLLDGANRDPVRLNVIGMPVAAEVVVGHHHLRADFADDLDELRRGNLEVGLPEAARILVRRCIHHPGVAVTAGTAEKPMIANAQGLARLFEFVDAPAPELVGLVRRDTREGRHEDLALFAHRAGNKGDVDAVGCVHAPSWRRCRSSRRRDGRARATSCGQSYDNTKGRPRQGRN